MPILGPLSPSVALVHAAFGDLVQVRTPQAPPVLTGEIPPGLRPGEVVQCLANDGNGVLVARGDGTRVLVPVHAARKVEVRWFPHVLETE